MRPASIRIFNSKSSPPADAKPRLSFHCPAPWPNEYSRRRDACVSLRARQITSGHYAHAAIAIQSHGCLFVTAICGDIEPQTEAVGRSLVAVAIAEDRIRKIELQAVEPKILLPHALRRYRRQPRPAAAVPAPRRGHVAQFVKRAQEFLVAGDEADAHAGQIERLDSDWNGNDIGIVGSG